MHENNNCNRFSLDKLQNLFIYNNKNTYLQAQNKSNVQSATVVIQSKLVINLICIYILKVDHILRHVRESFLELHRLSL